MINLLGSLIPSSADALSKEGKQNFSYIGKLTCDLWSYTVQWSLPEETSCVMKVCLKRRGESSSSLKKFISRFFWPPSLPPRVMNPNQLFWKVDRAVVELYAHVSPLRELVEAYKKIRDPKPTIPAGLQLAKSELVNVNTSVEFPVDFTSETPAPLTLDSPISEPDAPSTPLREAPERIADPRQWGSFQEFLRTNGIVIVSSQVLGRKMTKNSLNEKWPIIGCVYGRKIRFFQLQYDRLSLSLVGRRLHTNLQEVLLAKGRGGILYVFSGKREVPYDFDNLDRNTYIELDASFKTAWERFRSKVNQNKTRSLIKAIFWSLFPFAFSVGWSLYMTKERRNPLQVALGDLLWKPPKNFWTAKMWRFCRPPFSIDKWKLLPNSTRVAIVILPIIVVACIATAIGVYFIFQYKSSKAWLDKTHGYAPPILEE